MKIFIKTLLFVFVTLITNTKVVLSANVAFLDIQETTTSLSFHKETPKTVFMVIENDWVNRCQNERDLVAYRGWGTGVADDAAKTGVQYTKSSLKLGQEMHKAYKVGDVVEGVAMKEFRRIPGIRPDFVDLGTKTIYELKPFNPRAMQQGWNQLNKYQNLFQQKYGGTWKTILDTY